MVCASPGGGVRFSSGVETPVTKITQIFQSSIVFKYQFRYIMPEDGENASCTESLKDKQVEPVPGPVLHAFNRDAACLRLQGEPIP